MYVHISVRPTPYTSDTISRWAQCEFCCIQVEGFDKQKVEMTFNSPLVVVVLLGRVALVRGVAGYSHQTFPWTICRSVRPHVRRSVRLSVCPVHCGKTVDRIRMPFGVIGHTGPGMRQLVEFGDRSAGRGTFGGEFGARHFNNFSFHHC